MSEGLKDLPLRCRFRLTATWSNSKKLSEKEINLLKMHEDFDQTIFSLPILFLPFYRWALGPKMASRRGNPTRHFVMDSISIINLIASQIMTLNLTRIVFCKLRFCLVGYALLFLTSSYRDVR